MSVCGISTKGNEEQKQLVQAIFDSSKRIVIVTGQAGTGKTFLAIAAALQLLQDKVYRRIYYSKDVVQVGDKIGYLKGSIESKTEPFLMSLYDTLDSIERVGKEITAADAKQKIEFLPIFNIRGRNIASSLIVVDECENLSLNDLRTVVTRGDDWSKIILLGSYSQIDLKPQLNKSKCDFQRMTEAIEDYDFVQHVHLVKPMRSSWCTLIDNVLFELEKSGGKQ